MGSGAADNAASSGTNGNEKPARTPGQKVLDFLRTEAFYLAVVLLVAVLGSVRTWKEFQAQAEQQRTGQPRQDAGPGPLLQKDLDAIEQDCLNVARQHPDAADCRRAAAVFRTVQALNLYLCWGGAVVALVLGLSWGLQGRGAALPAASDPPWGLWDVCKLAALWVAGALALHSKFFFPLSPERPFAVPGDWIAEIFVSILLVGVTIHIVVAERGGHLRDLGIRGKFFGSVGVGLAALLAIQPFLRLVEVLEELVTKNETPVQQLLQVILRTRSNWVLALAAFVAVVVAPVSEELLFRGFLQPALGRWTGRWAAIVLSAAFFAAAHMDLFAMPTLLILGIALAYVYDRTRSLAAPVALHMAFNALTLLSVFAFRGLIMTALSTPR
jgi:membrane protease YdiL (CAAX protease family)